jgi:predicted CoA-substrate-specific enzyme activase
VLIAKKDGIIWLNKMDTIVVGLDIGSTMTKVIVYNGKILSAVIGPTGPEHRRIAYKVMLEALSKLKMSLDDINYVVATGYGRLNVPFADKQITEITCHARGVNSVFPNVNTAIDIGGQDCKGIKIAGGKVLNFVMNDKCAAGTGRFLEVIADALDIRVEEMGELSLKAKTIPKISSTCTVFAEQEVISWLALGTKVEDILAGIHEAIATRVHSMAQRVKIEREVVVTGGCAKNVGLVRALERKIGYPVLVPPEPLLTGAIGAAIIAEEMVRQAIDKGIPVPRAERRLAAVTFFDEAASRGNRS